MLKSITFCRLFFESHHQQVKAILPASGAAPVYILPFALLQLVSSSCCSSPESHQQVKVVLILVLVLVLEKVILVLLPPKVESNGQVLVCPARFNHRTLKCLKF